MVGAALIVVGIWALRRSARVEPAPHVHGAVCHDHLHVQAGPRWMRVVVGHPHASFCLGVLHGIAGSSHFLGVIPALALPTRAASVTYIAAFGVGTIVAMTAFSAMVGYTGAVRPAGAHRVIMASVALVAIAVGGVWLM